LRGVSKGRKNKQKSTANHQFSNLSNPGEFILHELKKELKTTIEAPE